ncbi:hypothetical protein ABZ722_35020 [Streptomyces longwoodensis]|uniref:hypothetical protein n=1 Tax=Streptomyces longwoodensis TaxID=68231 RepID=UPI0034080A46
MADRTAVHRWDQRFAMSGNEEERSRRLAQLHAQGIHPALFPPEVLVTALLAPFVATAATSLGTSLSGSIEKALRTVLRNVPRRAFSGVGDGSWGGVSGDTRGVNRTGRQVLATPLPP